MAVSTPSGSLIGGAPGSLEPMGQDAGTRPGERPQEHLPVLVPIGRLAPRLAVEHPAGVGFARPHGPLDERGHL
jgi:hypothetical protein